MRKCRNLGAWIWAAVLAVLTVAMYLSDIPKSA